MRYDDSTGEYKRAGEYLRTKGWTETRLWFAQRVFRYVLEEHRSVLDELVDFPREHESVGSDGLCWLITCLKSRLGVNLDDVVTLEESKQIDGTWTHAVITIMPGDAPEARFFTDSIIRKSPNGAEK